MNWNEPIREGGHLGNMNLAPTTPKPDTAPKPQKSDTIRRELDRVQRQLEGLSKVVKKIKEAA